MRSEKPYGSTIENEEIIELISENKAMSLAIEAYGTQKSANITTVKRLAEFLVEDVLMSSGVSCSMVFSKYPEGAPVTESFISKNIFQTEEKTKRHFLRELSKNIPNPVPRIPHPDWNVNIEDINSDNIHAEDSKEASVVQHPIQIKVKIFKDGWRQEKRLGGQVERE
ncbi:hypothetical protein WA158_003387 [Blastocystis sp. Blastoise]